MSPLAALLALALAPAHAPVPVPAFLPTFSQAAALTPELERRHRQAVRAERTARFFELWAAAPAERRAAAERALSELRRPGSPLDSRPSLEALALAARVLEGGDLEDARADLLVRFADALDVRLVPGVARAGIERGEPLIARVSALHRTPFDSEDEIELALFWVDAVGHETPARREPFHARHFVAGFAMHLRAPSAEPGTWRLVPRVTCAGRTVRAASFDLEVVPRLEERLVDLADDGGAAPLVALRRHGVRPADGRGASARLDALERVRGPSDAPSEGPSRRALLVVAPLGEDADALFRDPIGATWRAMIDERGLRVATMGARAALEGALVGEIDALGPRVVLVARADAVTAVHLALAGADVDLEGLVLCGTLPRPGPALSAVPTLLVGPTDRREPDDPADLERVRGGATAFLSEPALPTLVGAWLDRLSAGR